jgi:hypothetical protein
MAKDAKTTTNPGHKPRLVTPTTSPVVPPTKPVQAKPEAQTSGDQKGVSPQVSGDQNDAPAKAKKAKKPSQTVLVWRGMKEAVPGNQRIRISADAKAKNPKGRKAGERFSFYKENMTVEEYTSVMKEKGRTPAQTMGDIKWDIAAGFITVA